MIIIVIIVIVAILFFFFLVVVCYCAIIIVVIKAKQWNKTIKNTHTHNQYRNHVTHQFTDGMVQNGVQMVQFGGDRSAKCKQMVFNEFLNLK